MVPAGAMFGSARDHLGLLGRLVPDHKTIADFRKDNGGAIKKVCARFVELCRRMGPLSTASVATEDADGCHALPDKDAR